MAEKLRRMVMRRKVLCDLVVGATRVQGLEIGGSLGEYLSPVLEEGETLPDTATLIQLYGRKLQSFSDVMVATDERYLAEIATLDKVEAEVERQTRRLQDSILSLRDTCRGLIGKESLRPLGLDFLLARDAPGVLRQAEIIRERVISSEELVPTRWLESPLNREASAQELDAEIGELRVAVDRMIDQRKEVDTAKVRKDSALKAFDANYIPMVRMLEATFRVVGEIGLADRIRPTVRQLQNNDDQETEGEPSEEAQASEASETPPSESSSPESDVEATASDGQAS